MRHNTLLAMVWHVLIRGLVCMKKDKIGGFEQMRRRLAAGEVENIATFCEAVAKMEY